MAVEIKIEFRTIAEVIIALGLISLGVNELTEETAMYCEASGLAMPDCEKLTKYYGNNEN